MKQSNSKQKGWYEGFGAWKFPPKTKGLWITLKGLCSTQQKRRSASPGHFEDKLLCAPFVSDCKVSLCRKKVNHWCDWLAGWLDNSQFSPGQQARLLFVNVVLGHYTITTITVCVCVCVHSVCVHSVLCVLSVCVCA